MKIEGIEKLREDMEGKTSATKAAIFERLDAIEREVDERFVGLPKDAGGETIHVGDMVTCLDEYDELEGVHKVLGLSMHRFGGTGWCVRIGGGWYDPEMIRHHHEPTVEDVLKEMLTTYDLKRGYTCGHVTPQREVIAEYAEMLQLRGKGPENDV